MVDVKQGVVQTSQQAHHLGTPSDGASLVSELYPNKNERDKEQSPSQDSKRVRFSETTESHQISKHKSQKYNHVNKDNYSVSQNSYQSYKSDDQQTPNKSANANSTSDSKVYRKIQNGNAIYQSGFVSSSKTRGNASSRTCQSHAPTSRASKSSSQNPEVSPNYQFHASSTDTLDSSRLIFQNKVGAPKLTPRNDDFKYHANENGIIEHSKGKEENSGAKSNKTVKTINDNNKSATSSKKSEVVPLPPAKQNGHLVTSDESYSTSDHGKSSEKDSSVTKQRKNNKSETTHKKEKRLSSDPVKTNKVDEKQPRQSKSAPSENQKELANDTPPPKLNNYTKNLDSSKPDGQTGTNKPQDDNSKNRKANTKAANPRPDAPTNYAKNTGNSSSPTITTTTQSDAKSVSSEKKETSRFKWRADPRSYANLRTPRSKTPRSKTPRSKTPRSKTPKLGVYRVKTNFGHRTRYTKSEPGDYGYDRNPRTPEPKRSILNNREAVKLEPNYARPKSFKWERDRTIYRTQIRDWENDRTELTYRPSVNSPTDWLKVYVGDIRIRDTLKSSMSRRSSPGDEDNLSPNRANGVNYAPNKEVILSRQQANVYKNIHSVYKTGKAVDKTTRENRFFKKLQEAQILKTKLAVDDFNEKQKKKQLTSKRQQMQLKELRQRFEDAAWVRFNTQYVTSRVLEHEKMNRYAYGLPEEVGGEPEYATKLKRKPVKTSVDVNKLNKVNKKKYGSMFKIYKGPQWEPHAKTPPMEGIDTVDIEVEDPNGNKRVVTRRVTTVIRQARKEIDASKANTKSTGLTPRVEEEDKSQTNNELELDDDDDDDDMSDIFERARKKYNLDIDDDEDSKSRR